MLPAIRTDPDAVDPRFRIIATAAIMRRTRQLEGPMVEGLRKPGTAARAALRRMLLDADELAIDDMHMSGMDGRTLLPLPFSSLGRKEANGKGAATLFAATLAIDSVVNQTLEMRLLAQMGCRAVLASNGIEAIESIERQPCDLVLMDVQMPKMDGLEASRRLTTQLKPSERPRIVAMTANAMQADREECLATGMEDCVTKPIRVETLVTALMQARSRDVP